MRRWLRRGADAAGSTRELSARTRGRRATGDAQPRHRTDRWQRLAAKSKRCNRLEILERGDLAGGVALHGERQLVGLDADAIVAHPHQAEAALLDVDLDAPRAGIERVLDQLLDDGGRPLDDLAGGDLIDQGGGQ